MEVTAAVNTTLPVNPPDGVTVMVDVFPVVAPAMTVTAVLVIAKPKLPAAVLTVSAIVVEAVSVPEVPVMVTVDVPVVAVLLVVSVSTLVPVVGFVPNAAVTPLGNPDAARVTLPVNPFTSVTVIVSVAPAPCATDRVDADGASV
jgi:hypothetical protein